jgi:hypothetical protein
VNGYKRQPFTAYRAVDPPRSCVSRLPRRHRGLEIVAALHNRERSNNEAAGIAHNPPVTMVATPTIRDRVSRLLYLVYSETRASLFGPTAVTASPRPSSYAPRFALGSKLWPRCGHIRDRWARMTRAVGPAAEAPRSRVGVGCLSIVRSVATRAGQGQRTSRTLPGVCNFDCQTTRSDHHADERTQEGPRRASRAA